MLHRIRKHAKDVWAKVLLILILLSIVLSAYGHDMQRNARVRIKLRVNQVKLRT